MGLLISNLLYFFQYKQKERILIAGPDGAGKTTILYRLKIDDVDSTIPTIGLNDETVEYKNISYTVWDINDQQKIRQLWHHYIYRTPAIIYVVDSSDVELSDEVKKDLHGLLADDNFANTVLLVVANKQDMPNALSLTDLCIKLKLYKVKQDWMIHPTCSTNGKSLYEGLDYLLELL